MIRRQIHGEPGIAAALKAGERITMDIDIINIGAKSKGLTINIVGSCVENENIVFEYIRVFFDKNIEEKQEYAYESVFKRVDYQDGRKGYSAKIENIELPNSIPFAELMKRRNNMDSFFMFQLQLFGKAVMPTEVSDMKVFIHPIENYYDGYICINTTDDFRIIE